jgi:transcriptional regulator with XRE-family HTH domain
VGNLQDICPEVYTEIDIKYFVRQRTMTDRANLRRRAAVSLRELARKTSISRSRLSLYENHAVELLDDEVARIAAVLGPNLERTPVFSSHEEVVQFLSA